MTSLTAIARWLRPPEPCRAAAMGLALAVATAPATASPASAGPRLADFILRLQDPSGCIADRPGGDLANEDSNLEYALIGLAAAYGKTREPRYLTGFERGVEWLFARQDRSDSPWNGSWWGAYSSSPPYPPVPRPDAGIRDFRGVDTTSALPAYLLDLHRRVTGSAALAAQWETQARAGLDFVLRENMVENGLPGSSWQLKAGSPEKLARRFGHTRGPWVFWDFQYTGDSTDNYLGFTAGCRLYGDPRYCAMAEHIRASLPLFFDPTAGRFYMGLDSGAGTWEQSFNGLFGTLYPIWAFGSTPDTESAYRWALRKLRPGGRSRFYPRDPGYSLAGCLLLLGGQALNQPAPPQVTQRLLRNISARGGIRDTAARNSPEFNNVAGFCAAALLGLPAL